MPASRPVTADRFRRKMCEESFYQFFLEFWETVATTKLKTAWYIKELCDELQRVAERIFDDKPKLHDVIWNCPPGTTKSKVASVLWNAWVWIRMPKFQMITGSYTERLSLDLARQTRDCIVSDKFQHLFPEVRIREDQNAKGMFMTTAGGWRFSTGVGGSVTGQHAHAIVIDDPINPQEALSAASITEANTWMSETLADRKVDKMLTPTVLIMQRLAENDPTGHMLSQGGPILHRCIPADDSWEVKPPEWQSRYVKVEEWPAALLDPVRIPPAALEAATKRGEFYLAGQYGQSPKPRGGGMFKTDRFNIRKEAPKVWKRRPVRYWDKAGTKGAGCYTVGIKMAVDMQDRIWILDVVREQLDSGEREQLILRTAKRDGRDCKIAFEREPGSSGKETAEQACKRYARHGFRVSADLVRTSKEDRADCFSVEVNDGNVYLLEGFWNEAFLSEYSHFPASKYKDQVDSGSGCYLTLAKPQRKIGALT